MSERRGCKAMRFDRSTHRNQPIRDEQVPLRKRMREIALVRVRYGYRRIQVLLRREGWAVNHKRVQRLYREEGLNPSQQASAPACHGGASFGTAKTDRCERSMGDGFCVRRTVRRQHFRALTVVDA